MNDINIQDTDSITNYFNLHNHDGINSQKIQYKNILGTPKPTSSSGKVYATLTVGASDALNANSSAYDYFCDGTDDDVQIQAAIDALPTEGGRIILSEGTFNIGATILLSDNMILQGQGNATNIFLQDSNDTSLLQIGVSSETHSNISIIYLSVDGNMANQTMHTSHGIDIQGITDNILIANCMVKNTDGANIYIDDDGTKIRLIENNLSNTNTNCFFNNIYTNSGVSSISIINNIVGGGDTGCLFLADGNSNDLQGNLVEGNFFFGEGGNATEQFSLDSSYTNVCNNTFFDSAVICINCQSSYNSISGNNFLSFNNNYTIAIKVSFSTNVAINSNFSPGIGSGKTGIDITASSYCTIDSNVLRGVNGSAIGVILQTSGSHSTYNVVNGNNFQSGLIKENSSSDGPNIITSNIARGGITVLNGSTVSANNINA